ncbi:hypothetical protein [Glutamicibacter sp. 0426]|uniref:hypothetical protein n=1 Tax=Glutamicibacter sp. 0426 TaxID=1913445 RepID=UPI00093ABA68|nr:hypothetical protein [Glutamicibacter sp. 0426]
MRNLSPADQRDLFLAYFFLLVAVAYQMLGSVANAEDWVQHAWHHWGEPVPSMRAEVQKP